MHCFYVSYNSWGLRRSSLLSTHEDFLHLCWNFGFGIHTNLYSLFRRFWSRGPKHALKIDPWSIISDQSSLIVSAECFSCLSEEVRLLYNFPMVSFNFFILSSVLALSCFLSSKPHMQERWSNEETYCLFHSFTMGDLWWYHWLYWFTNIYTTILDVTILFNSSTHI